MLLSLSTSEVALLEQGLARLASPEAQQCRSSLLAELDSAPVSADPEVLAVWSDGASVQVRAITVHGDPVDMGVEEARDYARRILEAADRADAG